MGKKKTEQEAEPKKDQPDMTMLCFTDWRRITGMIASYLVQY